MQRIHENDEVMVIAGNGKGKTGRVLRVDNKKGRVVVEGVNIVKKHQRPQQAGRRVIQAGVIEFEGAIDMSNVMLICPHTQQPTRVGFRINEQGIKVRYSKKSGKDI